MQRLRLAGYPRWAPLLGIVLTVVVPVAAAAGFQNEPDGFGNVKLGMSVEAVRQHLPALAPLADLRDPSKPAPEGSAPLPAYAVYQERTQAVLSFKECSVRYSFLEDKLYRIEADCGRAAETGAALEKRYGPPTLVVSRAKYWQSPTRTISLNVASRVFALMDPAIESQANDAVVSSAPAPAAAPEPGSPKP